MSVKKNQCVPLSIETLSSDGSGIGHFEGEAVFVPGTAPGDLLEARIVKDCGRYAFGIVERVVTPSAVRRAPDCPVAAPCGGCCFRHITYEAELAAKQQFAADAFARIGGFSLAVDPIRPSPQTDRYRNKAQFPIGTGPDGKLCTGFYAGRSHRIVPCADCLLQPARFGEIAAFVCAEAQRLGMSAYDEQTGRGLLRHLFLRQGAHSGEMLVCLVAAAQPGAPARALAEAVRARFADVQAVLWNVNPARTNVILGEKTVPLCGGRESISDTLCGVPVEIGPHSFYQINTPAAEQLYGMAAQLAGLTGGERLLDLYCGMGTIGLSMVAQCAELIGVEIVPEAIAAAKAAAAHIGPEVAARCRFLCADAGQAAQTLADEGLKPDVIVLDPPRKGCDAPALDAVLRMAPDRIVMVSCNPATAARDARYLADRGYALRRVCPADLFPRTRHVEVVVLLEQAQICGTDAQTGI
jgi:23S rRNA (uracil1939-C5)-methyltransferase